MLADVLGEGEDADADADDDDMMFHPVGGVVVDQVRRMLLWL